MFLPEERGQRLGPFDLGERLGRGGMGTVYRALDRRTGNALALKVLHPWRTAAQHLIRFKREFRAAARLQHPHCLRVFELQSSAGRWFYTMEYAPGGALQPGARGDWRQVGLVALQILAALDHVHAKRIVHRDIKPSNILLDGLLPGGAPRVKVADFGISKVSEFEERSPGEVLGTLGYLAPEQLHGQADPRSDLYALGVVLYEALTGTHPFADALERAGRSTRQEALRLWGERPARGFTPLRQLTWDTPPDMAHMVERLLSPSPDDRYPTAATAFDELQRALGERAAISSLSLPPLQRAAYLATPAFVGRGGQRKQLRSFLQSVAAGIREGEPFLCFLAGAAGSGKSRMLADLLASLGPASPRVEIGAWRADAGGPWALRGLFRVAFRGELVGEGEERGLPPPPAGHPTADTLQWSVTRATLVESGTGDHGPAGPVGPADDIVGEIARLGGQWAIYRRLVDSLLEQSRVRPLLFVLEDAHWADVTSLELLEFLIRSLAQARNAAEPVRIGFVLTHRPVEVDARLQQLRQLAASHAAAATIELGTFSLDEAVDFVCSTLSCPPDDEVLAFTRRLHEGAAGSPLFLGQILQLLLAEGKLVRQGERWDFKVTGAGGASLPRDVGDAIGDRAARLSMETNAMLAAAAVLGAKFEFEVLHRTARIEPTLLLDCLDEALRAEFVGEDPDRPAQYQFVHEKVRDAIVGRLADVDRRQLHARAAEALEERYGQGVEVTADVAYHLRACGDTARAAEAYEHAARLALGNFTFARAADLYGAALELARELPGPVPALLEEQAADACLQAGRYDLAHDGYRRLLPGVAAGTIARAELLRKLAEVEFRRGNVELARQGMEDALRALGERVPGSRAECGAIIAGGVALGLARTYTGRFGTATARASERRLVATQTCLRLSEAWYFSDIVRALSYTLRGLQLGLSCGEQRLRAEGISQVCFLFSTLGLHDASARLVEIARVESANLDPVDRSWSHLLTGMARGTCGDVPGYLQELRAAEALLAQSFEPMKMRQVWTLLGEAQLALGDVRGADESGRKVLRIANELTDVRARGWGLYLRGWAASRLGELPAGRRFLEQAITATRQGEDHNFRLCAEGREAFAAMLAGDDDHALSRAQAASEESARRMFRHPSMAGDGIFLAAAAAVRRRDGRLPVSVELAVRQRALLGRELASAVRPSVAMYWAGRGAYDLARGRSASGRTMIERAVAQATAAGLQGDLLDVHDIAARFLPPDEAAAHDDAAAALRARFRGTP